MRLCTVCAVLFILAALCLAAGVDGRWKAQMEGQNGARTLVFDLKSDAARLTGTLTGLLDRQLEILEGKIDGESLSFAVNSEWQGNPVKLVYKGKVAGDEMKLTMGTEDGGWSTGLTAKREP
jgi:hypothetical protein